MAVPAKINNQGIDQGVQIGRKLAFALIGPQALKVIVLKVVEDKDVGFVPVVFGRKVSLTNGFYLLQDIGCGEYLRRIQSQTLTGQISSIFYCHFL